MGAGDREREMGQREKKWTQIDKDGEQVIQRERES